MNDQQVMHAMYLDDLYHVDRVLAQGQGGTTELVSVGDTGPFIRKKVPTPLARQRIWSTLAECNCPRLPHVDATYELPDCFVVVYDYVPGQTLESLVAERGHLAVEDAVRIVGQVCEAAGALHERDIIHRDISPTNIVVAADGAHLIDLGIARMRNSHATRDTTSLGTYGFAAPEQYGFAQTNARSDVYSIGQLLGYMLTGVRPDESSAFENALADESLVPAWVRAVIEKASAFEPSLRFRSAAEVAAALGVPVPNAGTGSGGASAKAGVGDKRTSKTIVEINDESEPEHTKGITAEAPQAERRQVPFVPLAVLCLVLVAAVAGAIGWTAGTEARHQVQQTEAQTEAQTDTQTQAAAN